MPKKTLADLIDEPALKDLAGDRSFARGTAYLRSGTVTRLVVRNERISARVAGSDTYAVKLWPESGALGWSCTCPMGEQGEFCKHAVATGLAWLARGNDADNPAQNEFEVIRRYLEASDKQVLVETLLDRAEDDDDLASKLLLAAQRQGVSAPAAIRETLRRALAHRDFIDYYEMPRIAAGARPVPEMLRETLKQGDARTALELAAEALKRGLNLLEHSDDSDGMLGDILGEIAQIHLSAVLKHPLVPDKLAKNVFDLLLADEMGVLAPDDYLDALGDEGLAAFRSLAEAAWAKVPALAPGQDDEAEDDDRFQITEIMKALTRRDGDADALVEVLARDLSEPHAFLEIAQALSKAGRDDEALDWAEKGRKASGSRVNYPLDDFLVAEYHRRKRHDDAVGLRWSRFFEQPSLHDYQQLKESSERAKGWNIWREKALAALRKSEAHKSQSHAVFSFGETDAPVLVQIFLWEGDPRAALEQARTGGCLGHLWLEIARALEADSPTDAIAIYRDQIGPIVRGTGNHAYDQAADLIRRMHDLMAATGRSEEFASCLATLRSEHKAKRHFIKRLEGIDLEKTRAAGSRRG
ncbi:MAG TPA: SWIM zinc finger family protein [Burkholderiales bacterium]|nr:SWIM zinc finger family protein [Burkholderiales bacterium]